MRRTIMRIVTSSALAAGVVVAVSATGAAAQWGTPVATGLNNPRQMTFGLDGTLYVAVTLLVLGFRSSDNLGGAYGIAVTLAMLIDTVLVFVVMRQIWRWRAPVVVAVVVPLLAIDIAFLASNALKIPAGGWFPLVVGAVVFTLLTTWKRGRIVLMQKLAEDSMALDIFDEPSGFCE